MSDFQHHIHAISAHYDGGNDVDYVIPDDMISSSSDFQNVGSGDQALMASISAELFGEFAEKLRDWAKNQRQALADVAKAAGSESFDRELENITNNAKKSIGNLIDELKSAVISLGEVYKFSEKKLVKEFNHTCRYLNNKILKSVTARAHQIALKIKETEDDNTKSGQIHDITSFRRGSAKDGEEAEDALDDDSIVDFFDFVPDLLIIA